MTDWKPTACILCSENCGLEVKVADDRLAVIRGDKAHPESQGYLCQKAGRLDHYQNHAGRLEGPLRRRDDGSFERISWDVAIAEIAHRMKQIKAAHGGRAFAYYGGGGQGNHLGGVYSGALRAALGTPYLYTALAQEKTGDFWVNGKLFGRQTCHVSADVAKAQVVLFLGTNPWQSHGFPRAREVLKALQKDPTRTMIVVDPRRTETAAMADLHLQVRPGGDAHLLGALLGHLVQQDLYDKAFLADRCTDADPVLAVLSRLDVAAYAERAGVPVAQVREAARLLGQADSACVRADLGLQQSAHSTLNSYLEKLTFLLTGNLGKPGGNVFHSYLLPLIGHSPDAEQSSERTTVTGMFPISKLYPPNILPAEIDSDHPGRLRALIVDSANPLVTGADTHAYERAFAALELLVVIDVALTETARAAHYVLPAPSQFEKAEATFFNLTFPKNGFHLRHPVLAPKGDTLPEPEIHRRLCVALGALPARFPLLERIARFDRRRKGRRLFATALKARIALQPRLAGQAALVLYDTLGKALPDGLASAAVLWAGCQKFTEKHAEAVKRAGVRDRGAGLAEALFDHILQGSSGIVLSHHTYEDTWSFLQHTDGRVHLAIPHLLEQLAALPDEPGSADYPFLLMAGERRSYNANTVYRDPAWRRKDPEGALRIHPLDAAEVGVGEGDTVKVQSRSGALTAQVALSDSLRRGFVSLPHGYGMEHPNAHGVPVQSGPRVNRLTDAEHCDPLSKTPLHKAVPVRLMPVVT